MFIFLNVTKTVQNSVKNPCQLTPIIYTDLYCNIGVDIFTV